VALLTESAGLGGAERMMLVLADALRAQGIRSHLVAPTAGWLLPAAQTAGHDITVLPGRHGPDLRELVDLVRALRAVRPDVIHAHMFVMAVYGSLAARILGIPCVVTLHEPPVVTRALRRRLAMRSALALADVGVVVSEQMRQDAIGSYGASAAGLKVIPNGVAPQSGTRDVVRTELGLHADEVLAVAIGTVNVRKNHVVAVRALASLPPALRCHLAIAGRDDDATELLVRTAEAGGVRDRLHLLGVRHDIGNLLAAADLYLMPSHWEGLPMALIEAQMSGVPAIAAAVGGIPEVIEPGVTGFLHAPDDAAALATHWTLLATQGEWRARIGQAGRRQAISAFGADTMAARYVACYRAAGARMT
jgi:glycosyltransferase involved in cell wall biosynthesis